MEENISRKKNKPTEKEKQLAKRLKNKRLEQNLSLQQVADELKVSKVTVSRYENLDITNIPSINIEKMAKLYKTTPSYLMGWEKEETNTVKQERYRWVARNAKKMTEEDLKRLQKLMEAVFNEIDFDDYEGE